MSKKFSATYIAEVVSNLCIESNYCIREDIFDSWKKALEREDENTLAKETIGLMIKNAALAWHENLPICQDTGLMVFFVEKGTDVLIEGDSLTDAINKGVELGGKKGCLRKSITLDPLKRDNEGSYGPAVIHYHEVPGDKLKIIAIPVGCGAEQYSCVRVLPPCNIEENIKKLVVQQVKNAGSRCCPPTIVGVGIGGNLEHAAYLARKALCRSTSISNKEFLPLENEILEEINKTNIGPQGFGGKTTSLSVNIEAISCHRANLPIAIAFNCHLGRLKEIILGDEGKNVPSWHSDTLKSKIMKFASEITLSNSSIHITTPLTKETIDELKVGDKVLISGTLYTARDAAHKKLQQLIQDNKPLPFELRNQVIYYVGPTPAKPGSVIGSAGPTTSARMDTFTPLLLSHGLKGMIGKGSRDFTVLEAIKRNKCIYFAAIGGLGALLSKCIIKSDIIAYDELGTEAIRKLEVKDFPAVVACDSKGNSLYSLNSKPT
ncbi:MAG: fumarate hydratase [Bacteroidetes bacterium]|nr:fumarate hydratase [Bacteroidota bacterium]